MKAVILAAGRGTRIERVTQGKPKCLLAFGDRTILDYQIDALWDVGVSKIAIVIGHNGHCIVDHVRAAHRHRLGKLHFVLNPEFGRTNNIYSLWLARDWVGASDFLCLNADVLCHPRILVPAAAPKSCVSMIVDPEWRDETMKVVIQGGNVVHMSKAITRAEYSATYIGITAFSRRITLDLFEEIEAQIRQGRVDEFFNAAVERLIERGVRVGYTTTAGLPWAEIDDEADLHFANTEIYPRLLRVATEREESSALVAAPV
ncbi:MAG TPA: phosphocholine cytidylyltransferase family protein [Bryobacteraceae bacterium]|nr:phosphocholine cytidylyltransferase family protein [Bryobacteraceae bacterium]